MKRCLLLFLLIFIGFTTFAQDVELNRINALDEFKWGVRFYNQGLYEKSVFSFERSISFDSQDLRTHLWLGRAYFMKGDIEAALEEWKLVNERGELPLWLDSNINIIEAQRGVLNTMYQVEEWVTLYDKDFSRPSSILELSNGGSIVVSFLQDEISVLNSNGAIISRFNGGIEAFNRPFDIIKNGSGYIVTEFMGDKVTYINDLGIKTKSVEPTDYGFSGPSYLAMDSDQYFYVSDWGNRRVSKFDIDGNYILSIVDENIRRPTGILVIDKMVYIADADTKKINMFDSSGNFIETVIDSGLESPEGLSLKGNNSILIADGVNLKEYQIDNKVLSVVTDLQGRASKITKGVVDSNGNTLTADFNLSKFVSLTDIASVYSGLYTVIDRVSNENFPRIDIELQVYDRLGNPVVGLDNTNFLISENGDVVPERNVSFSGNSNFDTETSVILDFDNSCSDFLTDYYDTLVSIEDDLSSNDTISLVTAGENPELLTDGGRSVLNNFPSFNNDSFNSRSGIDLSIKLAASALVPSHSKRGVVLITNGKSNNEDFVRYSLNEINDFLKNNRISLSVLYLEDNTNSELEYLVEQSGGESRFLFSGKGPKGLIDLIKDKKSGYYVLSFDSLQDINNGELFTSVEVEVNFIRKSGRNESGFFVPVKIIE